MNVKPLGNKILVKRISEQETRSSGIILPRDKDAPSRGKILAVGSGTRYPNGVIVPIEMKVGETILFSKYAGEDAKIENEDVSMICEDDVLCVVDL